MARGTDVRVGEKDMEETDAQRETGRPPADAAGTEKLREMR